MVKLETTKDRRRLLIGSMFVDLNETDYPEICMTGELPKGWSRESLIADGLSAWGCCMAGAKPPENFGKGMALIGSNVGDATPDGLSKLADEILAKK